MTIPGTEGYAEAAAHVLGTPLDFAAVHGPYLHLIPQAPADVLDVGAGPGHDAAVLAGMGHRVVAAEPEPSLLAGSMRLHGDCGVTWLADGLPDLVAVRALGRRFDFILLSGVWMHLDADERRRGMAAVAGLLRPGGGVLALSLRHGPIPAGRRMFEVSAEETVALAAEAGLRAVVEASRESIQAGNRARGVTWTVLAFEAGHASQPAR